MNTKPTSDAEVQQQILSFWFRGLQDDPEGTRKHSKLWYQSNDEFDQEIRRHFGEPYDRACREALLHWCDEPDGSLALVILLDQFSRNIHRGTPLAFAQDSLARAIAVRAIGRHQDSQMSIPGRLFLYHPFHHSEQLLDQERGYSLVQQLAENCPPEWQEFVDSSAKFFSSHRDTIRQFSRFPHRNQVMGRRSTPAEIEHLEQSSSFGQ